MSAAASDPQPAAAQLPPFLNDPREEYEAARWGVAIAPLPARTVLSVRGPDAVSFLQGMLTQDVSGMRPGETRLACLLERKGHLVAPLWVLRMEDGARLSVARERAESVLQILERFHVLEDLAIEAMPEARQILLIGPGSERIVTAHRLESWMVRELGPSDRLILTEAGSDLEERLGAGEAVRVGSRTLERLRIEAGRPLFGPDVDGSHFPMEAGLEEALHYQKGCYVGQETIARIHFRGKVHRSLLGVRFAPADLPEPPEALAGIDVTVEDSPVGRLTSFAPSQTGGDGLGLGVLLLEKAPAGTIVQVGRAKGRVTPLPFPESGLPLRVDPGDSA